MTTDPIIESIAISDLPPLKSPLAGGNFAGILTQKDGTHAAVVACLKRSESRLTHKDATTWASENGGQLPTKAIGVMLTTNLEGLIERGWYWTCEEEKDDDEEIASYAWDFYSDGSCYYSSVHLRRFRAVRPLDSHQVLILQSFFHWSQA